MAYCSNCGNCNKMNRSIWGVQQFAIQDLMISVKWRAMLVVLGCFLLH